MKMGRQNINRFKQLVKRKIFYAFCLKFRFTSPAEVINIHLESEQKLKNLVKNMARKKEDVYEK